MSTTLISYVLISLISIVALWIFRPCCDLTSSMFNLISCVGQKDIVIIDVQTFKLFCQPPLIFHFFWSW